MYSSNKCDAMQPDHFHIFIKSRAKAKWFYYVQNSQIINAGEARE